MRSQPSGESRQHSGIDRRPATAHFVNGATEIPAVEQDDRSGDEVERSCSGLLVLQATVADPTEPMKGDCPG